MPPVSDIPAWVPFLCMAMGFAAGLFIGVHL